MDDLFQNPDDSMEVEPADLGPTLVAVVTSSIAKKLAEQLEAPWREEEESEMQEKISELVAAANDRGLKIIRVIVTRASGKKVSRYLDIDRINETRSLQ